VSTTDAHGADAAATATETHDEPHGGAGHGATGGHDDHHAGEEPLGPIDVTMWGLGVLGVILGGVVAVLMAMSVGVL
jgi:hypothetical protein